MELTESKACFFLNLSCLGANKKVLIIYINNLD